MSVFAVMERRIKLYLKKNKTKRIRLYGPLDLFGLYIYSK
jgi:hypothetical protein